MDGPTARVRGRDPGRIGAAISIGVVGGLIAMLLFVHRDAVGADTAAYWHAARTWLAGGDPYHPAGSWLPFAYAPWLLPVLVPWAVLPWPLAFALWWGSELAVFAASLVWAYERRPLAAALAFLVLAIPIGLNLDSGNVALLLALALWVCHWWDGRVSGAIWALATAVKWIPALFLPLLMPSARRWGLALLVVPVALSILTWPMTLRQLEVVGSLGLPSAGGGIRTVRVDHLVFLWALIPWLWSMRLPVVARRSGPRSASRRPAMAHRMARPVAHSMIRSRPTGDGRHPRAAG